MIRLLVGGDGGSLHRSYHVTGQYNCLVEGPFQKPWPVCQTHGLSPSVRSAQAPEAKGVWQICHGLSFLFECKQSCLNISLDSWCELRWYHGDQRPGAS